MTVRSLCRSLPIATALLLLWFGSPTLRANPPNADDVAEPTLEPVSVSAEKHPHGHTPDACDRDHESIGLPEQSRELLRSWSCHSFRWLDGRFGDRHDFDESRVSGMITVGGAYSEYDEFDSRLRLRVRSPLPNLSDRWDVLLGREDKDTYVRDTQPQDPIFYNPGLVPRVDDSEWLLGLGYRRKHERRGWDYSVGARLRIWPRGYVRAQYFYAKSFSDRTDLRFRQTFFWRSDEGFGTTSRGDLSHALSSRKLLRWEAVGTVSEERDGVDWYAGQTWYHLVGDTHAIALLASVRGETRAEVRLQEYGFKLTWRRPFLREWMYLSVGPSLSWPRYRQEETRDASWGFGAWIDLEFGDYRY